MNHQDIYKSLLRQRVHPTIAKAILLEYFDLKVTVRIADAEVTDKFQYWRGGRQGGIETPDLFNIVQLPILFTRGTRGDMDSQLMAAHMSLTASGRTNGIY